MLWVLLCLQRGHATSAALAYGLAVHLRIYPAILLPSTLLYLAARSMQKHRDSGRARQHRYRAAAVAHDAADSSTTSETGTMKAATTTPLHSKPQAAATRTEAGTQSQTDLDLLASTDPLAPPAPRSSAGTAHTAAVPAGTARTAGSSTVDLLTHLAVHATIFGFFSGGVFLGLGWLCHALYGDEFIREAFGHHLGRKDPRWAMSMA